MSIFDDLKMYGRFAWGLRGFLRERMTVAEATAIIQRRLAERETNFLRLVERGIFGNPRSPYLALLKLARCELGDIQALVRDHGLEGALRTLRAAGVYVTFEEFKGRAPIERHGQVIPVQANDFDNPHLSHYYYAQTGGTTGAGTRVPIDLDHLVARVPHALLAHTTHQVLHAPTALWRGVLPDPVGIINILSGAQMGNPPRRWFTPLTERDTRPALKNRLATWYIVGVGRLCGYTFPWPEPLPLDQASVIADWAAKMLRMHGRCVIRTGISMAVRISVAASEAGQDLSGLVFIGGTEPPTPAKVKAIIDSGARLVPMYSSVEVGTLGIGCANPADVNDLHFMRDYMALIQAPRTVPGTDLSVDAFHYTTLLPTAPKIMLNTESDDYGIVETRQCGCPLEALGFTEHLRHIRSFRKLTGEGVTLIGSEMVHILESVLPARFGGTPLDYQLVEEEDDKGFTRLSILIHPRLEILDEAAVVEVVLATLRQGSASADLAQALWRQAQTLRVKRQAPVWTARGKLNPLHLKRGT